MLFVPQSIFVNIHVVLQFIIGDSRLNDMICILDCLERGLSGGGVRKQIALFWEVLLWKPSGTIVTGVEPKLLPCRPDWVDDGIPLVINRLIDSVPAYSIGIYRCEKFWFVLEWVRFCQFRSHSSSHYTWTSHNVTCWRHWILTALWQDFKTSLIHPTCLLEFLTYNMKFGVLMIIGSCLLFMRVQVSHLFTFSWSSVSVTVHGACWLMLFILLAVVNDGMYLFIYLILIMLSLYISAAFRFGTYIECVFWTISSLTTADLPRKWRCILMALCQRHITPGPCFNIR